LGCSLQRIYSSLLAPTFAGALLIPVLACTPRSAEPWSPPSPGSAPVPPEKGGDAHPPAAAAAIPGPVITEIHYRPEGAGRPRGGTGPAIEATEFVELWNPSPGALDLSGFRFTKGIRFEFPAGSRLEPRAFALVAVDPDALREAFGKDLPIAGAFQGRLADEGERIHLVDAGGSSACDVAYLDAPPWPPVKGGMALARARLDREEDDPLAWAALAPSPGRMETIDPAPRPADLSPSLHGARRSPASPAPGEPVKVSVSVRSPRPAAPRVSLRFETGGGGRTIAMMPDPEAKGGRAIDPVYSAVIPGQPDGAVVRYRIGVEQASGPHARLPHPESPSKDLAYHVAAPVRTSLPVYHLIIDPQALRSLQGSVRSNRLWPAVFAAGGEVHDRVGVRFRGDWARSWPKKSWKIVFPPDGRFRGARRTNLNSSWRDPAFVREVLAYEIYRDCGALSLEARMVRLHLNGSFFGLFTEVESPRGEFLSRHGIRGSTIYKAVSRMNMADERPFESVEELRRHYSIETGSVADHDELWRFLKGIAEAEDAGAFCRAHVDIPRYVNYLCASAILQNWDSFSKNHFLVCRPEAETWCEVPWDLDRTLGDTSEWSFDGTNLPLLLGTEQFPGSIGWNRLQDRFLRDPALLRLFQTRLFELLGTVFTEEKIGARLDALADSIAAEADLDRQRWGGEADWRGGIEGVKRYVAGRRKFLLEELPGGEPRPPRNLRPAEGAGDLSPPVFLETGPYEHADPKVAHRSTRWMVREGGAAWDTPVLDETSGDALVRLTIPAGRLLPGRTYSWRACHTASNGKTSEFGAETSFGTGKFPFEAVPFDLASAFNVDIVADPGDDSNDLLDDNGGVLLVDGFDGLRSDNPLANGLPRNHRAGVHVLGPYEGPNAVMLGASDPSRVRIGARRGRYIAVRLLVAGSGDSLVPAALEYADGSREIRRVPCDDWYDDNPPDGPAESLRGGAVPVLNGMDRIRGGRFKDRKDPAVFEVTLAADPAKVLAAIVLEPEGGFFEKRGEARFHLLAATGIRAGAVR
jgi:spore coat protein H